jgi:phosphate transport system substrate-binding protein
VRPLQCARMLGIVSLTVCISAMAGTRVSAEQVTVAGSSTIQPVAEVLGQQFEHLHPETQINVQGGGSSVGITAPQNGLAAIDMVSRALHPDETRTLVATTFGLDGIALIVHASNPSTGLSRQQVVAIYTGALKN